MNNFQLLQEELAKDKDEQLMKVRNNINDSRGLFQTIGDLVELFFPKFVDTFLKFGSKEGGEREQSKYPHENN
jgi:hypothetical protein